MKKIFSIISVAALSLSVFLSGCNETKPIKQSKYLMGTYMDAAVYECGGDAEKAIEEGFSRVSEIESVSSAKLAESEVSALNKNGKGKLSDELYTIIKKAFDFSEKTDGALNCTLGYISDLWAIGTDNERVPTKNEISEYLSPNGWQTVIIDDSNKSISFDSQKMKLDLGAVAKGYAGDEMKKAMQDCGVTSAVLNLGGNIVLIGDKNGESWTVGITDPSDPSGIIAKLFLKDKAVVTSGSYERFFDKDGKRYHHILDGNTGYPAESGLLSATIISGCSADADTLSTACFVLGADKALKLIESTADTECVLITENMDIIKSSGITSENFEVCK